MNKGHICISICAAKGDKLLAEIHGAQELADLIEVRFDCLLKDELGIRTHVYRGSAGQPIITTFRPKEQGGCREISWEEREGFWNAGLETEFCDVEQEFVDDSWSWLWGSRICSFHDFTGVPSDLDRIFQELADTDAEIIKVAVHANDISDAIPVWKLLARLRPYDELSPRRIIPIAMGEAGKWTRILGLAHGAFLTYASLDSGKETAGGQITAEDLINVYRVKDLDRDTCVYGVIGDPVSSSLSPFMHNAGFADAGLNGVFLPLQVKNIDAFMRLMVLPATREVELNFAGFSVTMPHKQEIMKYLTEIDPVAHAIGAVNTVRIDGDKLTGYNTDAPGFIAPLKQRIPDLKDARVAVLGAGGAARSVVYALRQEQADVTVFARDPRKAQPIADEFGIRLAGHSTPPYEGGVADAASAADGVVFSLVTTGFDLIVNTTPLGMRGPNESKTPLTANDLLGVKFVYDLVTRRDDTPLLREAKAAGVPCIGGVEMLVAQGLKQFEIWTGLDAPAELMRRAVTGRLA